MEDKKRNPINTQLVLFLILAIFLVIFTLQNSESVPITFFFWPVNVPLVLVILICILIGYLLPHFSYIPRIWKLKNELTKTKQEKEKLEKEKKRPEKKKHHPEGHSFEELDKEEDELDDDLYYDEDDR